MEKENNDMLKYINNRNTKKSTSRKSKSLRSEITRFYSFIKKWGYTFFKGKLNKIVAFVFFVIYKIELEFFNIRQFIRVNGGLRKTPYGGDYRPY